MFSLINKQTLTDVEVCYKMMRIEVLRSLRLSADDFGIKLEISSQFARARLAHRRDRHQLLRPHLR